ncbi:hypothetical protein PJ985_06505 [Streptomyces sp. ACA25]|uniref:hypothetical protein n=1 Tax=Streptomyces sp. ACA25 TaxID=3022596 RepID=UPI0023078F54|nr:hypothetical protein [Streptomyces sp. ACA25]MDB1087218.1 hypothetical protein [Streptomyces sp. ACA25]
MNGPAVRRIAVRVFFAAFPLASLGLLAWVPALRFAVIRRRAADWAVAVLAGVLTAVYIAVMVSVPEGPDAEISDGAALYVLGFLLATTVHAVLGDRFVRPHRPKAWPGSLPPAGSAWTPPPRTSPWPYGPAPSPTAETMAWSPPPGSAVPYPAPPAHPGPSAPVPTTVERPPPVRAPAPPPAHPAPPPASPRMRQVAAELDELDNLLRDQDGRR